ncbi:MAG: LapA family protein [Bacteroidales bacterium]|nr:LapA family protein [Bacteroidales bacterium]MCF8333168.1 LapA family protein [Bacteroidales bacterium]
MQRYFFTTIVIIIIMVAFAVLNHGYVTIDLLFTKVKASLALTILVVFAIGAIISFLVSTPTILKHKKDAKRKGREIKELKQEVEKLKEQNQALSSRQTNEYDAESEQSTDEEEEE